MQSGAAKAHWTLTVYDHFDVELVRAQNPRKKMCYSFVCKVGGKSGTCKVSRSRIDKVSGTSNLSKKVRACSYTVGRNEPAQATIVSAVTKYNKSRLAGLIAIDACIGKQAFAAYGRSTFKDIILLLRPDATFVTPHQISNHVNLLHRELSIDLTGWFSVRATHLFALHKPLITHAGG